MLEDSININNFNWNSVVLKKIAKTSENYYFWPNLRKKGVPSGNTKNKKNILFFRNNKTIYFI